MATARAFSFDDVADQMGRCQLGHKRRTDRLVDTARRISLHPGGSLPDKLHDLAAYRGTLRLVNNPAVTHDAVLQPHIADTLLDICALTSTVLIIHDTTELDYSKQMTLSAMGQIGNGGGWGYLCHNSLAIDADSGELLGLVCQQLHNRVRKPPKEGVAASRERKSRESLLWVNGVEEVGKAPEGCHWVHVCDRGADTFEFLQYMCDGGHHFTIRSTHSRALQVESSGQPHLLHDLLRSLPAQMGWQVEISANKGQPGRLARLQCAWTEVTVQAPHVRKGIFTRKPLTVWAIRVWEVDAPAEVKEPLEWMLLSDEPITDGSQARQRVGYYEKRPVVEDYHKGQKTGLGIEQLQIQSQAGLKPLIALLSVLAVALLNARVAARKPEQASRPASDFFKEIDVKVLSVWRYKEERPLTVLEFTMALARLGGHLNRKCDGMPGWLTLWRGAMKLHSMVEYELSRLCCGKL